VYSMSNVTANRIVLILGAHAISHQPIGPLNSPFWRIANPRSEAYKEITRDE
jgi:hypothetical protein